jgi:hypothetical protein
MYAVEPPMWVRVATMHFIGLPNTGYNPSSTSYLPPIGKTFGR